jgi:hypothetical protein
MRQVTRSDRGMSSVAVVRRSTYTGSFGRRNANTHQALSDAGLSGAGFFDGRTSVQVETVSLLQPLISLPEVSQLLLIH